jgi:hypothetical protein
LLHERPGLGDETFERRMPVRELKKLQRHLEAFVRRGLRNISALFQAHEHPEDFSDTPPKPSRSLADRQARRFRRK